MALCIKLEAQTYAKLLSFPEGSKYNAVIQEADSLKTYLDFEHAEQLLLKVQHQSDDEKVKFYAQLSRADNFLRHKKIKEAIGIINHLLNDDNEASESIAIDLDYLQAQCLYQMGQYDSALVLYQLVQKQILAKDPDPLYKGEFLNNFGELYLYGFEDIPRAKKCFDEALSLWQNQEDPNHFNLGRIYYNLSNIYGRRTEAAIQLNYAEKAMSIAKLYAKKYPRLEFVCYASIAEAKAVNGNVSEAIQTLNNQIHFSKINNIDLGLLVYTYNDLAEYFLWKEEYNNSIDYNNQIFNLIEKNGIRNPFINSVSLRRQATCYRNLKDAVKAEEYFNKALSKSIVGNGRRYAQTLRYYVEFLMEQDRYEEALFYNDSSIALYTKNWEEDQNESYLYGLILGWMQKGELQLIYADDIESAYNSFLKAAYYMDCHRDIYYFDETELNIGSEIKSLYENIISVSLKLYKTSKSKEYLGSVLYAIESNKYQTLWKKIRDRELYSHEDMPDILALQVAELLMEIKKTNINYLKSNSSNSDEFIHLNSLKSQLAELTNDQFSYKHSSSTINLVKFQQVLNDDEAVIELFQGDSICYGLLILLDTVMHFNFRMDNAYLVALKNYQHIIRGDEFVLSNKAQLNNFVTATEKISQPFRQLLSNNLIFNNISKLIVVPDGVFTFLPFESFLLTNDKNVNSFSSLQYFINLWEINYHISGKMLLQSREAKLSSQDRNIIAIGPSEEAILFSAVEEVKHIKKLFGQHCEAVLEDQRNALLKNQFNHQILHLASHAVIDTNNFNLSYVHFGSKENEALKVYDYEISSHRFNNSLVVLNACETYQGKMYKGEGVYNLSQSFMIGGAASVISTLWKIEDQSAARLMSKFYENVKNGNSYETSINMAKREIMSESQYAHPFYWASYLHNGESDIQFNNQKTILDRIPISILLLSLIGVSFFVIRQQKQV
ncbi:MAG: CHAT domain-containing protein [Chitinophagales bacterium]